MSILRHVPYVLPHPDTPTMQITNFTPSPNCISPPSPGTPRTDASRSSVLPGHTSTHHPMKWTETRIRLNTHYVLGYQTTKNYHRMILSLRSLLFDCVSHGICVSKLIAVSIEWLFSVVYLSTLVIWRSCWDHLVIAIVLSFILCVSICWIELLIARIIQRTIVRLCRTAISSLHSTPHTLRIIAYQDSPNLFAPYQWTDSWKRGIDEKWGQEYSCSPSRSSLWRVSLVLSSSDPMERSVNWLPPFPTRCPRFVLLRKWLASSIAEIRYRRWQTVIW